METCLESQFSVFSSCDSSFVPYANDHKDSDIASTVSSTELFIANTFMATWFSIAVTLLSYNWA